MEITGLGNAAAAGGNAKQASASLADNFDTFLTLLTTQLQNQDPLDPLDTNEFTKQLVSFSQVEQAIRTNQNLEDLKAAVSANSFSSLVGYLGKIAKLDTNQTGLVNGEAAWSYGLEANADKVDILVKDASGRLVFKDSGETKKGEHSFVWNGTDNFGNPLPDGPYNIEVVAKTAAGGEVNTDIWVNGVVDSVETQDGVHQLSVNGIAVPLGTLLEVSEPALENS